jgi:hypothetical protein
LSNRTEVNSQVSNEGSPKVPDSVINVVKAGFKLGSYSLTMPMLDKLREAGVLDDIVETNAQAA